MPEPRVSRRPVTRVTGRSRETVDDAVAVERALELRIDGRALSVTLRTPGHDEALALGFLAGEGLIARHADVHAFAATPATCADEADVLDLALAAGVRFDWTQLERHFSATSACGLCGRAHLASLRSGLDPIPRGAGLDGDALMALPDRLREEQETFAATGGLHAAAWCEGAALAVRVLREDVGRHNAVDKVAGWMLEHGQWPATDGVLWVSGRAGAEIVVKAARARIPVLAAVGAPSSLAIDLAAAAGMTLVGFLRGARMNVYTGAERLTTG